MQLRLLTTHRWRLTVEITRYKNRLQGLLDLAWPEFLGQFSNLTKKTPRAILERWPLPQDLLATSPRSVRAQVRASSRGHIGGEHIDALLESARETIGLAEAAAERRLEITYLLQRWRLAEQQMDDLDARIGALVEPCAEGRALLTLPEISAVCAATILAELGTPEDFQHYRQILKTKEPFDLDRWLAQRHRREVA